MEALFGSASATLAALSLLVWFQAPNVLLWKLRIAVLELSPWAAIAAALLAVGAHLHDLPVAGALALAAFLIFLLPLATALLLLRRMEREMSRDFPRDGREVHVFRGSRLLNVDLSVPKPRRARYCDEHGLELDYYAGRGAGPRPLVLVFHGGGWDGGDPSQLAHFNRWLADRGFSVASATYRLAPRWTWPAPRDDARKALAWLKAHADELGFDASRIVVLGRSAGGQIAQTLAYSRPAPSIRGLVLLYSPSDMIFGYTHGSDDNVLPSRTLIKQYLGTDDVNSEPFRTSAGHLMVSESSPPTLIAHGTRDEIVAIGHSITLARALEEKRVPHYFLRFPLATHGFDYNLDGPSAQVFLRALARFLASTLA